MAAEQEFLQPVLDEVHKGRMKASEGLRLGGTYVSSPSGALSGVANVITDL